MLCVFSSALHLTVVGGQTGRGQGAGGGQTVGAGHFTSGHRGRGQGGHSPAFFWQAELSIITGCCFGILLFNTYLLRSGVGGHSVFNMYNDMSGQAWQGGMLLFKTYLLKSASRQGGQIKRPILLAGQRQLPCWRRHEEQTGTPNIPSLLSKPSFKLNPRRTLPAAKPQTKTRSRSPIRTWFVSLIGITEVIFLYYQRLRKSQTPSFPIHRRTSHHFRESRI